MILSMWYIRVGTHASYTCTHNIPHAIKPVLYNYLISFYTKCGVKCKVYDCGFKLKAKNIVANKLPKNL